MIETTDESEKQWRVYAWVRDAELEAALNAMYPEWDVLAMFRNTPGSDGQETTTIVGRKS